MAKANELSAITLHVPVHQVASLKDLLRKHPELHYVRKGWIVHTVVVLGSSEAITAFRPELDAWQHDWASRDAW